DDAVGGSTVDEFKPRWLGGVPGGGAIRREEGEQPKLPRLPRLRVQDRVDAEGGAQPPYAGGELGLEVGAQMR
uniref:hypothetical protein n=1 Tax=Vulcanisaeta distributa TaxID=164451 RepID=UPI000B2C2A7D